MMFLAGRLPGYVRGGVGRLLRNVGTVTIVGCCHCFRRILRCCFLLWLLLMDLNGVDDNVLRVLRNGVHTRRVGLHILVRVFYGLLCRVVEGEEGYGGCSGYDDEEQTT